MALTPRTRSEARRRSRIVQSLRDGHAIPPEEVEREITDPKRPSWASAWRAERGYAAFVGYGTGLDERTACKLGKTLREALALACRGAREPFPGTNKDPLSLGDFPTQTAWWEADERVRRRWRAYNAFCRCDPSDFDARPGPYVCPAHQATIPFLGEPPMPRGVPRESAPEPEGPFPEASRAYALAMGFRAEEGRTFVVAKEPPEGAVALCSARGGLSLYSVRQ